MSIVQGLSIIIAGSDPARLHAALSIASAWAALDRPARIFLQTEAAGLLARLDDHETGEGTLGLGELLTESLALGVTVTACQTGLALCGLSAEALPDGVETGGLVGFLAERGEDQLMMA